MHRLFQVSQLALTLRRRDTRTNQWSNSRSDTHTRPKYPLVLRPLLQRHSTHDDDRASSLHARNSCASNSAPEYERDTVRCGTTDRRPDFEQKDNGEKHVFRCVKSVDATHEELKTTGGEEKGTAIPADVVD